MHFFKFIIPQKYLRALKIYLMGTIQCFYVSGIKSFSLIRITTVKTMMTHGLHYTVLIGHLKLGVYFPLATQTHMQYSALRQFGVMLCTLSEINIMQMKGEIPCITSGQYQTNPTTAIYHHRNSGVGKRVMFPLPFLLSLSQH